MSAKQSCKRKSCSYCSIEKPVTDFYLTQHGKPASRCKDCHGLAERICVQCGSKFEGRANVKLCSPECKRLYRPRTVKKCEQCSTPFEVERLNKRFCSWACTTEWRKGRTSPLKGTSRPNLYRSESRDCIVCGTTFRATADYGVKKQIYCSHACYTKNCRVSVPENMAKEYLEEVGVRFEHQARFGAKSVDFRLLDAPIIIEVDGAYWHSLPQAVIRDRRKDMLLEALGFEVYRIDAEDVRSSPEHALRVPLSKISF